MKIKDCIKVGVEPVNGNILPITMPYFLLHMAGILAYAASKLAEEDFPTVTIGGEKSGGKGVKNNVLPAVSVLIGADMTRRHALFMQTYGFFKWFIEQEAPNDATDVFSFWYDHDFLVKKWNEYAAMEMEEKA